MYIYYDLCKWSDWNPCFTMNLIGKSWTRGPFMNGKCGLGITSKQRLNENIDIDHILINETNKGFLHQCSDKNIINTFGPQYCLKRTCVDWDNYNDPDFPPKCRCQAWYNFSRYYNGAGRLDPIYPDPFRIYLSSKNNIFDDITNKNKNKWFNEKYLIIKIDLLICNNK